MKRDTLIQFFKQHDSAKAEALSTQAKTRIKARLMNNLHKAPALRTERAARTWTFFYAKFALVAVCILILLTGTAYASSSAIPGDVLYPVKRAVEDTRVKLASTSETKAKLQVQFTEERLQELEKVERKAPLKLKATQIKPTEQTPPATATVSTQLEPEPEHEASVAENSARTEVSRALRSLEKTQADLQQQGKESVANDLAKTIRILNSRVRRKNNTDSKREKSREDSKTKEPTELQTPTHNDSPPPQERLDSSQRQREED